MFSNVFFNAIRCSLSPLVSVFSFDSIGAILDESKLVQDVVFLVGKTYLLHMSHRRTYDLRESLHRLQHRALKELNMPDTKVMTAGLVSSCLLSLVEVSLCRHNPAPIRLTGQQLILDGSAKGWRSLTGKIERLISMYTDTTQTLPHLGRSFYWFARISIAARAVCFGESLSMPPSALTCVRSDMPSGNHLPSGVEENIALLAMHLESWAQLQSRYGGELWSGYHCSLLII